MGTESVDHSPIEALTKLLLTFSLKRSLYAVLGVWCALIFLGIHLYIDLSNSHAGDEEKGGNSAKSFARLVAEHAEGTFDRADLVLERAVKLLPTAELSQARSLSDTRRESLQTELHELQMRAHGVVSMSMTDETGYVFANTVGQPPGGFLGDRPYFLALKNGDREEPVISEVILGRISKMWGLQVARKIVKSDGTFGGMVVANVSMSGYLTDFYSKLGLPAASIVTLRDFEHRILARYPSNEGIYGKSFPPTFGKDITFESIGDVFGYRANLAVDNVDRTYGLMKLNGYKIYAIVGLPQDAIMSSWLRSLKQAIIVFLLAITGSAAATILYIRKFNSDRKILAFSSLLDITKEELIVTATHLSDEVRARASSEKRTNLFFERQIVGMAITSPEKGWLQVNDQLCNMLGYSRDELFQKNWAELTYPADLASDVEQFEKLLVGTIEQYSLEKRFIRKDGAIVWTDLSVGCVRNSDSTLDYAMALLVDITARKKAEDDLKSSNITLQQEVSYRKQLEAEIKERELRFRTLFENATIGIFRTTLEGRFSEMNPALATMLGYDNPAQAMEAITDIANDIYVEPQVRDETISRTLAAGNVISAEHLYWRTDGSTWVGHLRLKATTDHEGNILYLEGWIDDVTERKQIEKIRSEKENELRAIVDASPFPMVISKFPDGNILFVNNAFSDLVGISTDECQNLLTSDFYEDVSDREAIIYKIRNSGRIINKEFGLRKSGGDAIWCMMSAVTFRFNKHDALLICLNDISARKQLEHSMQLANIQAGKALQAERTANQEQRNFLAMVSHEFRMPLAIIQAASGIVSLYTHEPDALDECDKIIRAVRKMTDLIEVCLSDARLETPTVMQNDKEINLYEFINQLCLDKMTYYTNTLVINGERNVHINCDLALFEIALSNLIDNAIKYSPKDSPINLTVGFDAGDAVVRIQDHSVGIGQQDLDRIFEKYFRSTKTDNVQGVGLGLFIVKRIIEMHGGNIAVESELGVGTTFIVSLPAISSLPS